MSTAARAPALAADRATWIAIGVASAVLAAVFLPEIVTAVGVWDESTAYGHCWLVLPVALWLLWDRRDVALARAPRPAVWPALPAAALALGWWVSDWLGIMEGRQLALIGFFELLLIAALGWQLWWALSAAFLYLLFLVPFGAFLTPTLQQATADLIIGGLRVLGIPYSADALAIRIPEGVFFVAEACAGLRFLIAAIAFGVLYAVTMFHSPWRRAGFIAVACVVPVVANGLRSLGIVLLGHVLGSAEAGAADHLIYGWVFFSAVIVLLALGGLPFRDALPPRLLPEDAPALPRAPVSRLAVACTGVVVVAICLPVLGATALWRDRTHPAPVEAVVPVLTVPAGCTPGPAAVSGPVSTQSIACGGETLMVTATVLRPGTNPLLILDTARETASAGLGTDIDTGVFQASASGSAPWLFQTARDTGRVAAYAVWVDGVQRLASLSDRIAMARAALAGGGGRPPVAISVSVDPGSPGAEALLKSFLQVQRPLLPLPPRAAAAR